MNKMYTPTPYLWGRVLSSILVGLINPTILTLVLYFGIGIYEEIQTFIVFYIQAILINLSGFAFGFYAGVTFEDQG